MFLNWITDWFTKGGTIRRTACGRMMCHIISP